MSEIVQPTLHSDIESHAEFSHSINEVSDTNTTGSNLAPTTTSTVSLPLDKEDKEVAIQVWSEVYVGECRL